MFKGSHISLAKYIVNNMEVSDIEDHKKAFYFGSILPDCTPSFLVKKHRMDETFDVLQKKIHKVTDGYNVDKGIGTVYCKNLGVITHYLADYFTYTHNNLFQGGFKEHFKYETRLKKTFKEYVKSDEARQIRSEERKINSIDELITFIKREHQNYLDVIEKVKDDCQFIVRVVYRVVDAIMKFFQGRQVSATGLLVAAYEA
ncbi:zinc dependent phospholipase C family protein [Anaerolentibacter hominis]|uniref:zinc dependent phospholipase C family protein n=1 Tax=Anaerolentibacter hominis TaxID=3079009 RepID=UPI0031B81A0E